MDLHANSTDPGQDLRLAADHPAVQCPGTRPDRGVFLAGAVTAIDASMGALEQ